MRLQVIESLALSLSCFKALVVTVALPEDALGKVYINIFGRFQAASFASSSSSYFTNRMLLAPSLR